MRNSYPVSVAGFIILYNLVYNDLSHPRATSIGNAYAWRTADGSYNNVDLPHMGQVGLFSAPPHVQP